MMDKLIDQLIKHEGEVLTAYKCPAGYITVGVGRNLEGKGITEAESRMLLVNDIAECASDLRNLFGHQWDNISDNRRVALADMRFNLGPSRFRSFRRMIQAIRAEDWAWAGKEAMDSRWATQVQKSRSGLIYAQLVGG